MKRLITFLAYLTVLASCDNQDDLDSFILEDVNKYNTTITDWTIKGEKWSDDPISITRELFRSGDPERKTVIDFMSETVDKATVTLIQEGLGDDSIDGEKRIIDFEKANGTWTIKQIRLGFKCWENRGHRNYSGHGCG